MQHLLESMFYYKTEPISTIFFLSVIAMFGLLVYILAKSFAEEKTIDFCIRCISNLVDWICFRFDI